MRTRRPRPAPVPLPFRDPLRRLARAEPRPHWIIVAAEPITNVDTTADQHAR